jgi:hypothetical protein
MPHCKNNPKRTYTGKEPSPKGLGFCASGEKEGTEMKGKDGNMWVKSKGKWVKMTLTKKADCDNIVKYVKTQKMRSGHTYKTELYGKDIDGKFYKWISYNKFADKSSPIERGFKKGKVDIKYVNEKICGNKKTEKDLDKKIHNGYKTYFIHDNGSQPFLVAIKDKTAKIYKIGKDVDVGYDYVPAYYYTDLIEEFKCNKIFIPKGYDGIDILSGIMKDHKSFRGNSVLLQVKDKYVYIGSEIYEFKPSDEIIEYYSQVGNSDVPYPVAIGKENVYFMLDKTYVPIKYFEGFKKIDFIDAYGYYYGHIGNKKFEALAKKMKGVKMIHKRV